ncbi:MAG: hypothetical protein IH838_08230 [Proteobacteria bacterium]|nr:hypothetical protein [Pseudomonadota bacterium]
MNELAEFSSLSDFQRANPNIVRNIHSLRWIVRHREQNGLATAGAVVKRQGRWFVHASRFSEWMLNGNDDHRYAA